MSNAVAKKIGARSGSALLIVLGMLAFMAISAVAFSSYMRATRLPSSYLRRSISSRMLVKAALAEAIDEVDAAVGNFPHPGVWNVANQSGAATSLSSSENLNYSTGSRRRDGENMSNKNAWLGRVYIGGTTSVSSVEARLIPQNETVSTLTLEGLAYIPPPLVNEARYYSRHSWAGTWHTMGFDAGRYAFCAIDVSDYFDINALTAGEARGSAPDRRISLAYLMENADHTQNSSSSGTQWDNLFSQISSTRVPQFISLADWNLYLKAESFGEGSPKIKSYFYDYVKNNHTDFYNGEAETDDQKDMIRRMSFVTDSWFPPTGTTTASSSGSSGSILSEIDLTDDNNQPFDPLSLRGSGSSARQTYYSVMNYSRSEIVRTRLESCIPGLGFCALWDYLDEDSQPLSLAIPTTERTPMICGLSPSVNGGALTLTGTQDGNTLCTWKGTPAYGGECHVVYKVKYKLEGLTTPTLQALVTYPFRNRRPDAANNYEIGGRLAYFLSIDGTDEAISMRTGNTADLLHPAYANPDDPTSQSGYNLVENAVMTVPLRGSCPQPDTFDVTHQGQLGAVKSVTMQTSGRVPQSVDFLNVTYEWDSVDVTPRVEGQDAPPAPTPRQTKPDLAQEGMQVTAAECFFIPLDKTGAKAADFTTSLAAKLATVGYKCDLKLNLAAWVWIKNGKTGKVADLVPACVYDDRDFNKFNSDRNSLQWGNNHLGSAYPIMRFDMNAGRTAAITIDTAKTVDNAVAAASDAAELQVVPQSVYVGDPRYNHAPESWFALSDSAVLSEQTWLDNCGCKNRDGDIFMMTSDQCYLQSIYELANLPRLSDFYLEGSRKNEQGKYDNPSTTVRYQFPVGSFADGVNSDYMWRTYDPFVFPNGNTPGDDFDGANITSKGNGFKVNPYTDSTNILMAAFANTPLEWMFAADSERSGLSWMRSYESAGTFNSQYAWNDYSSNGKIAWEDLENVAGTFMREMRNAGGDSWEDVYNDLGWYNAAHKTAGEDSEYLLGNDKLLETSMQGRLWNCDKKFLYGFWHDCFATQQQLFLIFVRAEPALMGGGSVHQTPPQLGGRAVALVWRDPVNRSTSSDGLSPHRTRVLFYRQFE